MKLIRVLFIFSIVAIFLLTSITTNAEKTTISGTVASVESGSGFKDTVIIISLGSSDGLKKGDQGWVEKDGEAIAYIKIVTIDSGSSVAVVTENPTTKKVISGLPVTFKTETNDKLGTEMDEQSNKEEKQPVSISYPVKPVFAITPKFKDTDESFPAVGNFSNGLALVNSCPESSENEQDSCDRFYIDASERIIIREQPNCIMFGDFVEGLCRIMYSENGKTSIGFINKAGSFAILPLFEDARDFSEGLAAVEINSKWGYINKKGAIVIDPQFYYADNFSEAYAAIIEIAKGKRQVGYIDKKGEILIEPQFDGGGDFSDDLAAVKIGDKWGYVNKTGEYVINPQFDSAEDFSDDLAAVKISDKWGYVNKTGEYAINPQFDYAFSFSEGLASVKIGDKWGYVNKTGRYIVNPQLEDASDFSEGLASVEIGGKWGYIDKTGRLIINPIFSRAYSFGEYRAGVLIGSKWGYIKHPMK
jgi:hypothetical protein